MNIFFFADDATQHDNNENEPPTEQIVSLDKDRDDFITDNLNKIREICISGNLDRRNQYATNLALFLLCAKS